MSIANVNLRNPYFLAILLLTIFGFILRLYDLGSQSFWYDEGYSVNAALSMLEKGAPILPSGQFYSHGLLNTGLIASSIGIFGESEFAARLPSVIFGTLTIPLVFLFARRITGDKKLALITTFLVTFSVLEIAWSRQARMYQQLQFFYILSLYCFYIFAHERSTRYLVPTIVFTILAALSHSFGFSLILIYILYYSLLNSKTIFRYARNPISISKLVIICASCMLAALIVGEVFFNVFSTVWQERVNYFTEYMNYLKETLPVISYLAAAGVIIALRKDYKSSVLLILATIVPLYLICFHIKLLHFRYLYFVLPFLFILFSYTVIYVFDLFTKVLITKNPTHLSKPQMSQNRLVNVMTTKQSLNFIFFAIIIGLVVHSSGFNFTPRATYYLEPNAPQPDFKQVYTFINDNMSDSDIIIDTWPALGTYYLETTPDYWLAFDISGTGNSYCTQDEKARDIYTNTPCLEDLSALKNVTTQNQSGWLIVDRLALTRLSPDITDYIEQNLTYHEAGSSVIRQWFISTYSWGQI